MDKNRAENIRKYSVYAASRDANGMNDSQVSKATGIATSTLSEWKAGTYVPKVDKLLKIAEALQVPLEELLA